MNDKASESEGLQGFRSIDTNLSTTDYLSSVTELDASERLGFAKSVLLFLFILVTVVFLASYISLAFFSENEKLASVVDSILDITKTAVPSIVTLVLGFYFGKKE